MEADFSAPPNFSLKDGLWQILVALVAHSLAIHAGVNMAFSTILLPQIMGNYTLEAENETMWAQKELRVDKDEASWIASLVTITTPIGSLLSGLLMDRLGRKRVCMLTTVPLISAWCLTAITSTHVYLLYIARALSGFGAGLSTVGLIYVSETSHASMRPMLLSLNSAFVSLGILLTTLLGYWLPWRMIAWCCSAMAATSLVTIYFLPESPIWLNDIGRINDTERNVRLQKSLKALNRNPERVQAEYRSLLQTRMASDRLLTQEPDESFKGSTTSLRPVYMLLILFFLQQFSGGYLVIFYAIQIFKAVGEVEVDEWTSLIVLGVIRFVMAIASSFLARSFGRKPLLIISGCGMSCAMTIAAFTILVPQFSMPSLKVICVLAFVLFSSFGLLVIPWTLIGELLPHKFRGTGSGLMISFAYLLMFVTVKLFMYVLDLIGLGFVFALFAALSLAAVLFVYFCIPETLGKTFDEIQASFLK